MDRGLRVLFLRRRRGGEGFLQKHDTFVQHALMDKGSFGIGGILDARIDRPDVIRQFFTAHVRHDGIGKQEIKVSDVPLILQVLS